jgi:hypothetical protein
LEREVKRTELTEGSPLRSEGPHWTVVPSKRKKEKKKPGGKLDTVAPCFKRLVASQLWKIDIDVPVFNDVRSGSH